uniref:Uncharacterized protein n=1 Tax=Biomphalaria glabrata TaxID=6526 RepID=A0A2C9M876_BIOGL
MPEVFLWLISEPEAIRTRCSGVRPSLLFRFTGTLYFSDCAVTHALRSKNTKTLNFLLTECGEETRDEIAAPETLIQAVKLGDIQLIQLLLDAGADIDGVHDDKTPLMSAVHIEVIDFLLSKGADVNFKTSTTPLINVLSRNYFNDINSTFYPKLNSNEIDQHIIHVIDVFLKNGASLEDNDDYGNTALIKSAQGSFSVEVLKYLLDKGADVNQKDCWGLTALHVAAESHKLDFVEVLLKYHHRGYVTYKDSALDAALESSFTNAARVLLDHGAELDSTSPKPWGTR